MSDVQAILTRMFDEVINKGHLDVADELFAEDFIDHGPMGDMQGRDQAPGIGNTPNCVSSSGEESPHTSAELRVPNYALRPV